MAKEHPPDLHRAMISGAGVGMPRRPRKLAEGCLYHVTARGNNRQSIFLDSQDYRAYLDELENCRTILPHQLVAFALMPNHVHLVMEMLPDATLSDVVRRINLAYTKFFNRRYQRVGQLYQGRFYSNLIASDAYLLEVTRYVHLNPWRAGLNRRPEDYAWSSYRQYLGLSVGRPRVTTDRVLGQLSADGKRQAIAYRHFVKEKMKRCTDDYARWIADLQRKQLIPSTRWKYQVLPAKVPGTL